MKIAFFGTPRLAQIVLEKLIDSPYKPQLVITAPDARIARGQKNLQSPAKETAVKNSIDVLEPKNFNSFDAKFDLAILIAYGKILPQKILQIPRFGFINIHPSLLPKYRGPTPVQTAILEGEEKTGVSIILLDKEVDHGPVLAQKEVEIEDNDNHLSLNERLAAAGTEVLLEILPDYIEGKLKPVPQDHKKATFTKHIAKIDGEIDQQNPPDKKTVDRMIRAYHPWPGVWIRLRQDFGGQAKLIKFLPNGLIQPEGKRKITIKEFKNGYPKAFQKISALFE
ncbi:MAG: methionyl-tRNA formyltransferase [Candidatus Curtissbacteria bacterium]|nr:methionyl-tRNA formyltransferase [Candidatus Curtissbacteria bacterium]